MIISNEFSISYVGRDAEEREEKETEEIYNTGRRGSDRGDTGANWVCNKGVYSAEEVNSEGDSGTEKERKDGIHKGASETDMARSEGSVLQHDEGDKEEGDEEEIIRKITQIVDERGKVTLKELEDRLDKPAEDLWRLLIERRHYLVGIVPFMDKEGNRWVMTKEVFDVEITRLIRLQTAKKGNRKKKAERKVEDLSGYL
jgi:hypothetical protein